MKKITLLAAIVTVCSFAFAQTKMTIPQQTYMTKKVNTNFNTNPASKNNGIAQNAMKKAVIWTETFAGGFPAGWTMTDNTGIGAWAFTTAPSAGQYAPGFSIGSTTAGNGWMIMDGDLHNNPGGGTIIDAYFTTSAIDLSANPAVNLKFEHYFILCCNNLGDGELVVAVSNDSIDWSNEWNVMGNVEINSFSNNPIVENICISGVAGGQPTVYLRFHWRGDLSHYWWMIDDIFIEDAPSNELILTQKYFNTTLDETNMEVHYFQVPSSQAKFDTITFGGALRNAGGAAQPNTRLYVDVSGQDTYSDSSAAVNLLACTFDSLNISNPFIPNSGVGTYDVVFNVSSDSTDVSPADNTMNFSFDVTDTVYSRDNGDNPMGWQTPVTDLQARANLFEIYTQDTATSISVRFGGLSNVGAVVSIHLWDSTLAAPIASNSFYTLSASDFTGWVTFPLPKTPMPPGPYFAGVEVVSDTAYVHIDNDPPFPTAPIQTYVFIDGTDGVGGVGAGTWFTERNNIPFMRLNVVMPPDPCVLAPLSATAASLDANCGVNDGSATVTINSGTPPYTYLWNDPNAQTTATADSLIAGTYTVIVTDANCTGPGAIILNVQVNNTGGPIAGDSIVSVTCNGLSDGEIYLTVSGGGGSPYTYDWTPCSGSTGPQATNLPGGSCSVTITDPLGCITNASFMVSEPDSISATTSSTSDDSTSTGTVTVSPSGGSGSYIFLWDDPSSQTTATAVGLLPGIYNVTVTDSNGCTASFSETVSFVTGLVELNNEGVFNIYPNPTNGQFVVEFSNQKKDDYLIEVRNIIGQLIYSEEIDNIAVGFTKQIDLSEHRGVYFLSISNSSGTRTEKLIVY